MDPNQVNIAQIQVSASTPTVPFHTHGGSDGPLIPLNHLNGYLPMVTATPTFSPTGGLNTSLALDSTTGVVYYYDFTNKIWKSTATDAHIHSLFSGTAPINYNSSTGVISFSGASNTIDSTLLAGESISSGNPVSIGVYQSDGGITFDAKDVSGHTASAGGTLTLSFNVGNNSNRLLVVFIASAENVLSLTYAGTSLTSAFTALPPPGDGNYLSGFYLKAPTTGSNNLVVSGLQANEVFAIGVYSYYNVDQTTPLSQAPTASNTGSISQAVTPNNIGAKILSFILGGSNATYSTINMQGNAVAIANYTTNHSIVSGDSYKVSTLSAITISASVGGGVPAAMASLEMKPATAASTRAFKSSSANGASYDFNTNWKAISFYGFARAAYSLGAAVSATTAGTDENQSGLTTALAYYLNDTAGTIGTSAGTNTRKAGIAISATQILITNIW